MGGIDTNTLLLVQSEAADGSVVFTDSSDNDHTVTLSGTGPEHSTDAAKFGTSSIGLVSTSYARYLQVADAAGDKFALDDGDFTIDFWVRFASATINCSLAGHYSAAYTATTAAWDFYVSTNGTLYFRVYGAGVTKDLAFTHAHAVDTWYHYAVVREGTALRIFRDGVLQDTETLAAGFAVNSCVNPLTIGGRYGSNYQNNFYMEEFRLSSTARWSGTSSFTPPTEPYGLEEGLRATLPAITAALTGTNVYDVSGPIVATLPAITATLTGTNPAPTAGALVTTLPAITATLAGTVTQPTTETAIRAAFYQNFGIAASLRRFFYQRLSDAPTVRAVWEQPLSFATPLRQVVEQVFAVPDLVRMVVEQPFAVTGEALRAEFNQEFAVKDVDLVRKAVHQVFQLTGVGGEHRQYVAAINVDGETVPNPAQINLERDIDQYFIEAIITPAIQAHFVAYPHKAVVVLTINGNPYTLMVTTPQRNRAHGGGSYTVVCQSPAVLLGESYADTVSGEYTGFASAIAAQLAPGFTLDWQVQDEYYRAGELLIADQYPIEIIRDLAAAVMGVVQSNPDGSIKVIKRRQVQVDLLQDATPDYTLSDVDDFSTVSEEPLRRKRYNAYTVTNQAVADEGLRTPDVTDISDTLKEVRGYQVPWDGQFDLTHRGGDWVRIEPMGIEERTVEEVVTVVDGVGATQYPLYDWSSLAWQQTNLGTITFSEDGSIEATVAGDSLLDLTYTTRCKLWQVTDARAEQLLLVAEEQDDE